MSRKNKGRRLTSVSAGAELILHVILGLFALCCVIQIGRASCRERVWYLV